ncbi:MAG: type ISP restriction/modification enzyme [Thermoguttaceae bacterium]
MQKTQDKKLATIHYHDIGDYLDREEKLQILRDVKSIEHVAWEIITPNEKHDWINQRDDVFDEFLTLGGETSSVFEVHSTGLKTNRDAWCYNFSSKKLASNMRRMIAFYNEQVAAYREHCEIYVKNAKKPEDFIDNDDTKISWTRDLKTRLGKCSPCEFHKTSLVPSVYRPFCKHAAYFHRHFNAHVGHLPQIFPEPGIENVVICIEGTGSQVPFSTLVSDTLPDFHLFSVSQCFPFYTYERADGESNRGRLVSERVSEGGERVGDYIRRENISDAMLAKFRARYGESGQLSVVGGQKLATDHRPLTTTKHDIFYYVYGVLNSPEYRERFSAELKKQLPRIPFATDFWGFADAGRKLAELHLNYETGVEYPLEERWTNGNAKNTAHDYRVTKMKFVNKNDKSAIAYNSHLTLTGIPAEAYRFVVNGKSAIEWILDRYQKTTHKDSGIENDPNDWCTEHNTPDYIVRLIKRVTHLSVESVKIVERLPKLEW